jgi:DNA-binding NtrC family response regulator
MSERDLLYKILFDMRRDVTELKQFVLEMVSRGGASAESLAKHPDLFHGISVSPVSIKENQGTAISEPAPLVPSKADIMVEDDHPYERVLDISHETEEESLSLQIQEKEMILKALKKNHNRRKYAARDLGISERTLYRKIKLFGIEE